MENGMQQKQKPSAPTKDDLDAFAQTIVNIALSGSLSNPTHVVQLFGIANDISDCATDHLPPTVFAEAGYIGKQSAIGEIGQCLAPLRDPEISLRDHFATHAMAGLLTMLDDGRGEMDFGKCAKSSYAIADAMLAARGNGSPVYTPAQVADAEEIKALVRRVLDDPETRIFGKGAAVLYVWANNMMPIAPPCQHQNIEVFRFNADRFSGSCRDCGADVRSKA
jgi:hypothetical protein